MRRESFSHVWRDRQLPSNSQLACSRIWGEQGKRKKSGAKPCYRSLKSRSGRYFPSSIFRFCLPEQEAPAPPIAAPLTIAEAKAGLARTFGVAPTDIEITVRG